VVGHWFQGLDRISLQSRRSRYHLKIAIALIVVIPMLSFCLLGASVLTTAVNYSFMTHVVIIAMGLLCGAAGYGMLLQYPANIERMRDYLARIASDDLPEHVTLRLGEQDSSDIERYLNVVIKALHDRIERLDTELALSQELLETIRAQSGQLVAAEQQRVMLESLGAACHHLGQPATILRLYLSRVRDLRPEVLSHDEFSACNRAVEDISDILMKLKSVSEYRTMPYATHVDAAKDEPDTSRVRIVDIEPTA
jgi:hypothetical protein